MNILNKIKKGCIEIAHCYYKKKECPVPDNITLAMAARLAKVDLNNETVTLVLGKKHDILEIPINVFESENYEEFVDNFMESSKNYISFVNNLIGKILEIKYIENKEYTVTTYQLCDSVEIDENGDVLICGHMIEIDKFKNEEMHISTAFVEKRYKKDEITIIEDSDFQEIENLCKSYIIKKIDEDNIFKVGLSFDGR